MQRGGGSKVNVIPDKAKVILDIRSPFGMDREFVDAHLYEAMGTAGDSVRIKSLGNNDATTSPADGVLWRQSPMESVRWRVTATSSRRL